MVLVEPISALVYVDGYPLKQRDDLTYQIGLLVGSHRLEIRARGYQSYDKEISVLPGRQQMLTIRLKRRE
jgi:hypothetical protein